MLLLHGAGTGSDAAPLPALGDALAAEGVLAVRLDQPYVVAGRRAPDRAALLDGVVLAVLPELRAQVASAVPTAFVGRSSGARVACRTAAATGTVAVVALGFPLCPPWRPAAEPGSDRSGELVEATVHCPVLVVQGARDPFGMPEPGPNLEVRVVAGGHVPSEVAALATVGWLLDRLAVPRDPAF